MEARPTFKVVILGDEGVGKTAFAQRSMVGEFEKRTVSSEAEPSMISCPKNHCPPLRDTCFHCVPQFQNKNIGSGEVTRRPLPLTTTKGEIIFDLWDYNGDPESVRDGFLDGARAALIMFDVTCRASYKAVAHFYRAIVRVADIIASARVGNKCDVADRKVKAK